MKSGDRENCTVWAPPSTNTAESSTEPHLLYEGGLIEIFSDY